MKPYFAIQQKFEAGHRLEAAQLLYDLARSQAVGAVDAGLSSAHACRIDALAEIVRALRTLGDDKELQEHARQKKMSARVDEEWAQAVKRFDQLVDEYVVSYRNLLELTKKKVPLPHIDRDDWLRREIEKRGHKDIADCDLIEYRLGRLCDDMVRLTCEARSLTTSYRYLGPTRWIREGFGLDYAQLLYVVEGITPKVTLLRIELLRLHAIPRPEWHPRYSTFEDQIAKDLARLVGEEPQGDV